MTVPCFWFQSQNFGDAINLHLVRWITGNAPYLVAKESPTQRFMLCGSILGHANNRTTVWGAGIGRMTEEVDPGADLRAVRGPISRWRALRSGAKCPEVYGDPALLLPRFYQPKPLERKPLGIIPHYVDQERAKVMYPGAHFINILEEPEKVIDEIVRCDAVASSALHGLVAAAAYGVKTCWLHMDDKLEGDGAKFFDFHESCGIRAAPIDLRLEPRTEAELIAACRKYPLPDIEALWNACPLPR